MGGASRVLVAYVRGDKYIKEHVDALLVEVDQGGAACHTGKRSCVLEGGPLEAVVGNRPAR